MTNPTKITSGALLTCSNHILSMLFLNPALFRAHKSIQNWKTIADTGVKKIVARRGMTIWLDRDVTLSILYPDRDVSGLSSNDGSIVARLSYGNTSVMLTGDTTSGVEKWLTRLDGADLKSTVLKSGTSWVRAHDLA